MYIYSTGNKYNVPHDKIMKAISRRGQVVVSPRKPVVCDRSSSEAVLRILEAGLCHLNIFFWLARCKFAPWLLLQPLDRMEPGQNTKCDVHGYAFEHIEAPLMLEGIPFDPKGEFDHTEYGPRL